MFHTRVKAASRIGPHHVDVISVIVGSLLGKCAANRRSVEGTRLCYRHSHVHKDYLFWLFGFFYSRSYCSNLEPRKYTRRLKKGEEIQEHYGYEFNTFTFRSFDWIHKMFYKKGKVVLKKELEKYLTPLALAVWCMSCGKHINGRIELSTIFRTEQDARKLIKMLNNCFGLICDINKRKKDLFVVVISKESVKLLQTIVSPFILNMKYHPVKR